MPGQLKSATATAGAPKAASKLRVLVAEALAAGGFNVVMATIITLILFHGKQIVPVWGASGVMFNTLPSSVIPVVLMTLGITHLARKRAAKGLRADHHASSAAAIRRLPTGMPARAAYLTICATPVVVGVTFLGVLIAGVSALSFSTFFITQIIQSFVLGAILGPVIVARALCEPLPVDPAAERQA